MTEQWQAQLRALDTRLSGGGLTALERSDCIKDRQRLYNLAYPDAVKHGGDRYNRRRVHPLGFLAATAALLGITQSMVHRYLTKAERIAPDVKVTVAAFPKIADCGAELDRLAGLTPARQRTVMQIIAAGKAETVRDVLRGKRN